MDKLRRNFIRNSTLFTGGLVFLDPFQQLSARMPLLSRSLYSIDIFHSNDLHNQLHSCSGAYEGLGGLENIGSLLQSSGKDCLVLDAGDFLHHKSNADEHRKMIAGMNKLGYLAATIGNKELANGCDYLFSLCQHMKFSLVNCNYSFSHTGLRSKVKPYVMMNWGQYRIGILGVGTDLSPALKAKEGIVVHSPYTAANNTAAKLKKECDLVICLSHLGYKDNTKFASLSENIDLIISGHQDELVPALKVVRNKAGEELFLSHGGWGGLIVRQLTISFDVFGKRNNISCRNFVPTKAPGEPFYKGLNRIKGSAS